MATTQVRTCDVFGTTKEVARFTVKVLQLDPEIAEPAVFDKQLDLSPRGVARLKKFIERGCTSPAV